MAKKRRPPLRAINAMGLFSVACWIVRADGNQPLELGARDQLEAEAVQELGIVALQDAKEVGDVPAAVVDHLGARAGTAATQMRPMLTTGSAWVIQGTASMIYQIRSAEVSLAAKPTCNSVDSSGI